MSSQSRSASRVFAVMVVFAAVLTPWGIARGAEAQSKRPADSGTMHTVTASVEYSTERAAGKQAALSPGEFTVPEGCSAGRFRYRWADPKTGRTSDRLTATTVYSITQRRYMSELKDDPNAVLPPGKYKLVVGGQPGAVGTLTYRLTSPADRPSPPDPQARAGDRIIDVETWLSGPINDYNPKLKATYVVRREKVTGTMDQLVEPPKYGRGITCDPLPHTGTFTGRIEGNVIVGKWDIEILPYKMHFAPVPESNIPAYERTDSCVMNYEIRLTLHADGTVSQTCKGTIETRWEWGATAPVDLKVPPVDSLPFEIPNEHIPDPLTGRWKERATPRASGNEAKP